MGIEIKPLSAALGAEVIGLDLSRPLDDKTFETLRAAWLEALVLVFRDLHGMSVEQHLAISRRFGRLNTDLKAEKTLDGHPEILVLSTLKKNGEFVGNPGGGQFWHVDLYFERIPAMAGFLHAIEVPSAPGVGDTLFANMYAAYEALAKDTKRRVDGRTNRVSRVKSWPINYPDKPPLTDAQKAAYADVFHPLVRTHPETGRKALFIGDVTAGTVEGLPEDEGDALLRELREFAIQPRFVYTHRWRPGDALLWDNRCTYHAATPFDQNRYRRHMHRTTIMDDRVPV
ncbi:MAG: TauD/TfdA family dioxygenase [Rhodospirillales bacterium]|jgi:alpha-ketoglutarate-dependent taurine dioxygenase|nr:TauD/TfdA family dioxygenase [Rhodospirillales bacterium]MDP6884974.1 TauD/TfdA family dioxygenase [Rhodospirillales bacterium]